MVINQGDDYIFQLVLKDAEGEVLDLTGCTYECKVRESAESSNPIVEAVCDVLSPKHGLVEVHFRDEDTAQIDTDGDTYDDTSEYVYDIIQTTPEGHRTRILQGMFYVSPGISYH